MKFKLELEDVTDGQPKHCDFCMFAMALKRQSNVSRASVSVGTQKGIEPAYRKMSAMLKLKEGTLLSNMVILPQDLAGKAGWMFDDASHREYLGELDYRERIFEEFKDVEWKIEI